MTTVRIYQAFRNARQSGMKPVRSWTLTFEETAPPSSSLPMNWLSSSDMNQELCLFFPSLLKAVEYAKLNGFEYTINTYLKRENRPKSYEDNFKCTRLRK